MPEIKCEIVKNIGLLSMSVWDTIIHYGKVVAALRETIRSLRVRKVAGVIESAGAIIFE